MMTAARILRPSREGWKLLVSALKQRWLSMAIWSWKVLPLRGSCGHKAASGRRAGRPSALGGAASPSHTRWPGSACPRHERKPRAASRDSKLGAKSTHRGVSRTPQRESTKSRRLNCLWLCFWGP